MFTDRASLGGVSLSSDGMVLRRRRMVRSESAIVEENSLL